MILGIIHDKIWAQLQRKHLIFVTVENCC